VLASVAAILLILALKKMNITSIFIYILCGLLLWYGLYRTGVHPTLAGVILGLLTPSQVKEDTDLEDIDDGSVSYIEYLQIKLHPYSSLIIVPIFAMANTGVVITEKSRADATSSVIAWGIFVGLVIGKPLGVVVAAVAASKARIADLPQDAPTGKLVATGSAAGIGFTVALFIADLAFDNQELQDIAVVAVIAASIVSAVISTVIFKAYRSSPTRN
jgi:NhaA family Na+:H+ antiporter